MNPDKVDRDLSGYFEKEFEVLSQAHFQTSQKTTSFFQFITLIFLAPLAFFTNSEINTNSNFAMIFLVIGILGFFITMYLADLRFESLLYARAVNKVRYSLYTKSSNRNTCDNQINDINHNSILLAQSKKPNYFDTNQFLWIVLALGLINSFYLIFGVKVLLQVELGIYLTNIGFLLGVLILITIHLVGYWEKSRMHENESVYFHKKIGSDIDGVISNQNAQFVKYYNMGAEDQITQDDILTLPVHKSGKVTLEDESKVFLKTDYWKTLEVLPGTREAMNALMNRGFTVHIFTSRGQNLGQEDLHSITRQWLKKNHIKFNKLYFDSKQKTRFEKAQSLKIKYFFEDDLIKAMRLCSICKAVFLVDYQYNQFIGDLPYNLFRVSDLSEAVDLINQID